MSENTVLVGSASWTDKSLVECGRFYPPHCRTAEDRLRYYASQFPMTEVDSSYYGIPVPHNAQLWAERTPAGFVFNIKAFRLFTGHQTTPAVLGKDLAAALGPEPPKVLYYKDTPQEIREELWRRFLLALEPLKAAGKLGATHFQFAPWVIRNRDGLAHVEHCVEKMAGHLVSVEFRNATWLDEERTEKTLAFERDLGVVHTIVDGPRGFANSVPDVWAVTNPKLAIVRLHGRNAETWNKKGMSTSSERFDYWYSEGELREMVPKVRELANQAGRVHVIFNNNREDQAQVGGRLMMKLLGEHGKR